MQMDLLKAGYSHGQVGQRPFDMGYKSMFVLQDVVNKKKVPDPMYTGLDVCTPENQATCIAK
jgi:ribose transport system substrate-binding protein